MSMHVLRPHARPARRRSRALVAIAIVLVVVATSLIDSGVPRMQRAAATTTWPVKIFSIGRSSSDITAALANPYVSGVSVRFGWASIEPSRGTFRWGQIDQVIRQARAAGKFAMIRVIAGVMSPDWVLRRVNTLTFSSTYLRGATATKATMAIPWKRRFLRLWKGFIGRLARRYDGNATLYSVQMPGCGFQGEMALPTDVKKWLAAGYHDVRYIRCWKRVTTRYRRTFHRTHLNLDIGEPFLGLMDTNVMPPVVRFATRDGIRKAFIQQNGLRAGLLGTLGPYRRTIRRESRETRVGYQMGREAKNATGLRNAFTVALQDQVSYVEVYASDVLDPVNQAALRYLASGGG
jgi:glycosyl hydrolase family 42 (putative beta-galactosidase)